LQQEGKSTMPEIIERSGVRYVMVREDEYLRLRAAEEDLEDVRLYDEAKAKPSEFTPLELTERMLDGESPVRVYREYRGFTQDQLGAQAGISKPFLSQIENGIRTPSLDTLKRLAEVLRVDMDDLV
jgi:DNA-binding XRE family transcriptional regulator